MQQITNYNVNFKKQNLNNIPSNYINRNISRFIEELKRFISFPSISARKENSSDINACSNWLAGHLKWIGLQNIKLIGHSHPPVIYAEWIRGDNKPTILVYGHYDVQPVDPLSNWYIPPFKPIVKGNYIFGRGSSDDKGQILTHLKAIEYFLRNKGELPFNFKCIFEGEEEVGSPNLASFLKANHQLISADFVVISDTAIPSPDQPALIYTQRGTLNLDLQIFGSRRDLHSGIFGGCVHNPLQAASEIISKLYDSPGHVAIPGFYKDVRHWNEEELIYMKRVGPSDAKIMRDARIRIGWGEKSYSLYERTTIRPTITVNGIIGGYQGPRVKSVIPSNVTIKLDFRLVPDQEPYQIEQLFKNYIDLISPLAVKTRIKRNIITFPVTLKLNNILLNAVENAYLKSFGKEVIFLRSGGTLPVVDLFTRISRIPIVLMGYGLPDDGIHGPNEKFYLPNFFKGILNNIYFFNNIGLS